MVFLATIPRMVTHHPKNDHPPSKIKIYRIKRRLGIWHLDLIHRMAPHNPMDGHSPSKIYQKELYYKLGIWQLDLTNKIKTG